MWIKRLAGHVRQRCGATPAVVLLLGATMAPAAAQTTTPAAGEYTTEGGWGVLTVTSDGRTTRFSIETTGGNMHTCSLEGEIRAGVASLEAGDGQRCTVRFSNAADGIEVSSDETCHDYYCGVRAIFDGSYLRVPPGCGGKEQQAIRATFKRLYDKKSYTEAQTTLEPLLSRCGRVLDRIDGGWIRNDLAITQHRLGDDAACRRTLQSLAADAAKSDDEVAAELPPMDAEAWLPVVKATRTNLRLCGGGRSAR